MQSTATPTRLTSLLSLLAVVATVLLAPATVQAGTYDVYQCRSATGGGLASPDLVPASTGNYAYAYNLCGAQGLADVRLDPATGHGPGDQANLVYSAAADTRIVRIRGNWAA